MNLSEFWEKLKYTEFATHRGMKCRVTVCEDFVDLEYGYDEPKRDFLCPQIAGAGMMIKDLYQEYEKGIFTF